MRKIILLIFLVFVGAINAQEISKSAIKQKFRHGSKPNEQDFIYLIDNSYNKIADSTLSFSVNLGLKVSDKLIRQINSSKDSLFKFISIQRGTNSNLYLILNKNIEEIDRLEKNSNTIFGIIDTLTDNNFNDKFKTKLENIEFNSNNYQLPLANFDQLGGIKLGPDFVTFNQKLYTTIDSRKVHRQYASDSSSTSLWTDSMKVGDEWTRVRMRIIEEVDNKGNYDTIVGEWNPPYKFNYQDMESQLSNYMKFDTVNTIIGKHRTNSDIKRGNRNTFIGNFAGYSSQDASNDNTLIGDRAGFQNSNSNNVMIGSHVGQFNNRGNNTLIGSYAGAQKELENSITIGSHSGFESEASNSIFIGNNAGYVNNGVHNIAIGINSQKKGYQNNSAHNISIGYNSLLNLHSGKYNSVIGNESALSLTSGNDNIIIGYSNFKGSSTASNNIIIGNNISAPSETNNFIIGLNKNILLKGKLGPNNRKLDIKASTKVEGNLHVDGRLSTRSDIETDKIRSNKINNSGQINAKEFIGYGTIPKGGIIMWSGGINEIPDGWILCDGSYYKIESNGKVIKNKSGGGGYTKLPNLSGRFIIGAGQNNPLNSKGGGTAIIKTNNLPSHSHQAGNLQTGHLEHSHEFNDFYELEKDDKWIQTGSNFGTYNTYKKNKGNDGTDSDNTTFAYYSHSTSGMSPTSTDYVNDNTGYKVKIEGKTSSTGKNEPLKITPKYYALAYIMRIK